MSFFDVLSLVGAFAVIALVLVLTYYASRWYARRMNGAPGSGRYITFCDRVSVGPGQALIIAQIGEAYYLLGISDKNMQLICPLTGFVPEKEEPQRSASFGRIFSDFLQKNREGGNDESTGAADE